MKFQDSSFIGLSYSRYKKFDAPTHARMLQKQYAPSTFFKVGGITTANVQKICNFHRVADEVLLTETVVWTIYFLIDIITARKGTQF